MTTRELQQRKAAETGATCIGGSCALRLAVKLGSMQRRSDELRRKAKDRRETV